MHLQPRKPGLHKKKHGQQAERGIFPSTHPTFPLAVQHPALECSVHDRRGPDQAGSVEAMQIMRGLELLSYEERLKQLMWFGLEKRRLCGDLVVAFQYIRGDDKHTERDFFYQGL